MKTRRHDLRPRQHKTLHHRRAGLFRQFQLPAFLEAFEQRSDALLLEGGNHGRQKRETGSRLHQLRYPGRVELDDVGLEFPDPVDVGIVGPVIVDRDAEAVGLQGGDEIVQRFL